MWEFVGAVIDRCGRLDVWHLILLYKIQFYRRIFVYELLYVTYSYIIKCFCFLNV